MRGASEVRLGIDILERRPIPMLYRESIFLTGFPGFIAGRLLERLVKPETQFFLLVQPHLI